MPKIAVTATGTGQNDPKTDTRIQTSFKLFVRFCDCTSSRQKNNKYKFNSKKQLLSLALHDTIRYDITYIYFDITTSWWLVGRMSQPMQSHIFLVYVLRVLWAHALVIVACWLSFVAASSVATRYTSTIHYSTTTTTAHCHHHRHRKQPDEQSVSQIAHELFLSTLPPKKMYT